MQSNKKDTDKNHCILDTVTDTNSELRMMASILTLTSNSNLVEIWLMAHNVFNHSKANFIIKTFFQGVEGTGEHFKIWILRLFL